MQGRIFMETFTAPKELVENSRFKEQKKKSLSGLTDDMIDPPLIEIITRINKRPYCFTLQSCYGHFLYPGQQNPDSRILMIYTGSVGMFEVLDRLRERAGYGGALTGSLRDAPPSLRLRYRIAYVAFCIENSQSGKTLLEALGNLALLDPYNIQFCSAEWFWQRQVNSYALQVEPERFKHKDRVVLDYTEALNIEKIRNEFFVQLGDVLNRQPV